MTQQAFVNAGLVLLDTLSNFFDWLCTHYVSNAFSGHLLRSKTLPCPSIDFPLRTLKTFVMFRRLDLLEPNSY